MRKLFPMLAIAVLFSGLTLIVRAAEEKTFTGEGMCAKCALKDKSLKACQNAIKVEEDGKEVTYYITNNKVAKDFHPEVCKESKKIKVTGTVQEVKGKKEITASKIDVVED